MPAQRYFIRLSFNGKNYHGWQVQPNAHSVQAELDQALAVLTRVPMQTVGCGRTDTGVHAREFYAHFDHSKSIPDAAEFCHHLNGILPVDIAAHNLIPVSEEAHARFDATARTYEYHLYSTKNPFLRDFASYFPKDLDYERMNDYAGLLLKQEDFSSFSKSNTQVFTKRCVVSHAAWEVREDRAVFTIRANRFLRNMVRAVVGTLLLAGERKINSDDFKAILDGKDRRLAGTSMPACGLYLTQVEYPYIGLPASGKGIAF